MIKYVKLAASLWEEEKSAADVLFFLNPDFCVSLFSLPVREAVLVPGDESSLSRGEHARGGPAVQASVRNPFISPHFQAAH